MTSIRAVLFRIWVGTLVGLTAVTSFAVRAQVDDPADQRRISRLLGTLEAIPDADWRNVASQQVTMDLLDSWLGSVGRAQQTGDCEAFEKMMAEYASVERHGEYTDSGPAGLDRLPPEYASAFRNRLNAMRVHGCTPYARPDNLLPDRTPVADDANVGERLYPTTGVFRTDRGEMVLGVADGSYTRENGKIVIDGASGNTVEGTWLQTYSVRQCRDGSFRGRFAFTFSATGFSGKASYCDDALAHTWNGVRVAASDDQVAANGGQVPRTGVFDTDFGRLTLGETGGTYNYKDGRVSIVSVDGDTVEGTWVQSRANQRCVDGSYRGRFLFTFTRLGFSGMAGYCDETPNRVWNGVRVDRLSPVPSPPVEVPAPLPPPQTAVVAGPLSPSQQATVPAPRPAPISPPAFQPLPTLKSAEPGWDVETYRTFRDHASALADLRAKGRCDGFDGYWRALETFGKDLEAELAFLRTYSDINGPALWRARQPVVAYFQAWSYQARDLGCNQANSSQNGAR